MSKFCKIVWKEALIEITSALEPQNSQGFEHQSALQGALEWPRGSKMATLEATTTSMGKVPDGANKSQLLPWAAQIWFFIYPCLLTPNGFRAVPDNNMFACFYWPPYTRGDKQHLKKLGLNPGPLALKATTLTYRHGSSILQKYLISLAREEAWQQPSSLTAEFVTKTLASAHNF